MGNGAKGFWLSFFLTLAVLAPLAVCVVLWSGWQNRSEPAGQNQTAVPITAVSRQSMALLLVAAPDAQAAQPGFVLCKLDCMTATVTLCALPGQTVLAAPGGAVTLSESYLAAGPARAAQLLAETLGAAVPAYLAATPAGWQAVFPAAARLDTSRLLQTGQRAALGIGEPVIQLEIPAAAELLAALTPVLPEPEPESMPSGSTAETAAGESFATAEGAAQAAIGSAQTPQNAAAAESLSAAQGSAAAGENLAAAQGSAATAQQTAVLQNQLRGAVWDAFLRQNLTLLPAVPGAIRQHGGLLLTSLSAAQLLRLQQMADYLAARETAVQLCELPGSWNAARFELNAQSTAFAKGLLG